MSVKRQIPALTGLRFFLALWVLTYHQAPPIKTILQGPLLEATSSILHTGYSAVTAFFVLSGFVLAYNYDPARFAVPDEKRRFAIARFSRIYPAYVLALVPLLPLFVYRLNKGIEQAPPWMEWSGLVLSLLLLQAWLPQTALLWNYPGWSLSNEAFFYACYPSLATFIARIRRPRALVSASAILWALSCAAPLIAIWAPVYHWGDLPATTSTLPGDVSVWANIIRYNPLLRLPEFCGGIVLANIYLAVRGRFENKGTRFYLPSVVLILLLLTQASHIPYPLLHNGLALPLFEALILGLALGGGFLARILSYSLLEFLGNASYTMYILHVPIYYWLGLVFTHILGRAPEGWLWFGTSITMVILISCFFLKFIEGPLHRALRNALLGPKLKMINSPS
jgi:peptidoglycan/LPS O-acetylase OafA/YrhL